MPLEEAAGRPGPAMIIQVLLVIYLVVSFVVSLSRVYRVSWLVAASKALAIILAYVVLVAGSFEAASIVTMPESASLPFLTD